MVGRSGALTGSPPLRGPAQRRPLWLFAVLAVLLAAIWFGGHEIAAIPPAADRLSGTRLVGARGPDCVQIDIAVDVSGSMREFAGPRDAAVDQLAAWMPANLRSDDRVSVTAFAADSALRLAPVPAPGMPRTLPVVVPADGPDTLLGPALTVLDAMDPSECLRTLVLFSDAQIADLPADEQAGRVLLRAHGLSGVVLLVPGESIQVPPLWEAAFPAAVPVRFDGADPDATGLALGQAVAGITRQTLESR